jgi:DNA-binding transcriptional LysR family regulator
MLPKIALERELDEGILREVEIVDMPNPTRQIALISRRSRPLGPVAQAFVDIVQEVYSSETPAPVAPVAAAT